jgi:hypothetical protein
MFQNLADFTEYHQYSTGPNFVIQLIFTEFARLDDKSAKNQGKKQILLFHQFQPTKTRKLVEDYP